MSACFMLVHAKLISLLSLVWAEFVYLVMRHSLVMIDFSTYDDVLHVDYD